MSLNRLAYRLPLAVPGALRHPVGTDPMAALDVQRIIAVGLSQGAIRLVTYHNAVHPLAGVFDGFMADFHGGAVRTDLPGSFYRFDCC